MKKFLTYTLLSVAFAGIIALSAGFYQALRATTPNNSQATAALASSSAEAAPVQASAKKSNTLNVLIIGDSIAKGTGDEKGKGFSGNLTDSFKNSTSKQIQLNNLGIDGLESSGLLQQLQNKKWNQSVADSDLILISIGGNDLRSILTLNGLAQQDAFQQKRDSYMNDLKQSLKLLRTANPKAEIVFLGLYNPYEKLTSAEAQGFLEEWNYKSQQLIESDGKALFIPTYDLIKYNVSRYIAQDGLHPNASGYQAISNRISQSVGPIISGS